MNKEEYNYSGKSELQDMWDEFIEQFIKIHKLIEKRKHVDLSKLLPIQSEEDIIKSLEEKFKDLPPFGTFKMPKGLYRYYFLPIQSKHKTALDTKD